MDKTFTCILLLLSLSETSSKYVYVWEKYTWHEAQHYCRGLYTDLAPVSNMRDTQQLWRLVTDFTAYIWIGLERDSTDREKWMWSGGGKVSKFDWALGEPQNGPQENYGLISYFGWHDAGSNRPRPFFCYRAVVVRERKTWEEALLYCRKHHRDLASVASETEMLLIEKELDKDVTTNHVWIGLHFFAGRWLWVDRQRLNYKDWGPGGEPVCPKVHLDCAAIRVKRWMQRSNSTDSDSDATVETELFHTGGDGANPAAHYRLNKSEVPPEAAGFRQREWEARDCEEELFFVCY